MHFLYNIIQLTGLIVFAPLLFVKVILTPKYRSRILGRMGKGLARHLAEIKQAKPRFWIHALSVGEVSSSIPLVKALRQAYPHGTIIFSATTRTGEMIARQTLERDVDLIIPFPLDLIWVVKSHIKKIAPDLFIMVETDFWPNFLFELGKNKVPALLVNGRMSQKSIDLYVKFKWLFRPLFSNFSCLSMQTVEDGNKILRLGIDAAKVKTLGNLKYDMALPYTDSNTKTADRREYGIPADCLVWIAGSTHAGEEEVVFRVYKRMLAEFPGIFLVVAPRNIERGGEVSDLAGRLELSAFRRTGDVDAGAKVMVLDTLGELSGLYQFCDIVFLGGSLVPEGGHNPLEPACFGKPVLFGPHMEDFSEISRDLLAVGAARQVANEMELYEETRILIAEERKRSTMGGLGLSLVGKQRGVATRHVDLVRAILEKGRS